LKMFPFKWKRYLRKSSPKRSDLRKAVNETRRSRGSLPGSANRAGNGRDCYVIDYVRAKTFRRIMQRCLVFSVASRCLISLISIGFIRSVLDERTIYSQRLPRGKGLRL